MNAINRAMGSIFDVLLTPFELLGPEWALVLVSGLFGIVALLVFKQISWQAGIKGTKDKIKGHMIAIRLFQDDLAIVGRSVISVLLRNVQYLALNLGPILPLFVPFALVMAQLVVRYAFDPLPVANGREGELATREKNTLVVTFKRDQAPSIAELEIQYPPGIAPVSKLVRNAHEGRAVQHFVATGPVQGDIRFLVAGREVGAKEIVAGSERARRMQPERVSSLWSAFLWPAEDTFPRSSPLATAAFLYPDRELRYLPDGIVGVALTFLGASILFGLLILKPLNIQI